MPAPRPFGFVAIWNDIVEGQETDFAAWHRQEHMPERLAIPGFVSGQRWRARQPAAGYFTLYTLEHAGVARSEAYLERLNNPTPWTQRVMAGFRANSRCAGSFAVTLGDAPGEQLIVVRVDENTEAPGEQIAQRVMSIDGVAGYHLGQADPQTTSLQTVERQGREVGEPTGMLMIALQADADASAVLDALRTILADFPPTASAIFYRELALP